MQTTEPVSISAAITTIIESALLVLISFGVIDVTESQTQLIMSLVVAIIGVIAPALWARQQSTSLKDPRNRDGQPLYSAAQFQAMMQAEPPKAPAVPRREGD